jgi:hypothetical protein
MQDEDELRRNYHVREIICMQDGDELWRNYHVREIMGRADFPPKSGPGMSKPELNGGLLACL